VALHDSTEQALVDSDTSVQQLAYAYAVPVSEQGFDLSAAGVLGPGSDRFAFTGKDKDTGKGVVLELSGSHNHRTMLVCRPFEALLFN